VTANQYATLAEYKAYVTARGQTATTDTTDDSVVNLLIESASRFIDTQTRRKFYPSIQARVFDVPTERDIFLDEDLLELTTLTNGDLTVISASDYTLRGTTPPYWNVAPKDTSSIYWTYSATGSREQVISLYGVWGYHDNYSRAWLQVGTLSAAITDTTTLAFSATTGHAITVGEIVKIGSEIYNIASAGVNTITPVRRGDNGSTAATHLITTPIYAWQPMEGARQSCLEIAHSSYERRFGRNTSDSATVTAIGIVLSPQDIPATAKAFIAAYVRHAWQ
jgi:hypothetical protein